MPSAYAPLPTLVPSRLRRISLPKLEIKPQGELHDPGGLLAREAADYAETTGRE